MNKDADAVFSKCRKYRYALWRIWDDSKPMIMFLCLNPFKADETKNDRTVNRCINYSKNLGYGGMYMMNIFSYISTYPEDLKKTSDPIGDENNDWIKKIYKKVDKCIAAWGDSGRKNVRELFQNRIEDIFKLIPKLYYLEINKSGQPKHPLRPHSNLET